MATPKEVNEIWFTCQPGFEHLCAQDLNLEVHDLRPGFLQGRLQNFAGTDLEALMTRAFSSPLVHLASIRVQNPTQAMELVRPTHFRAWFLPDGKPGARPAPFHSQELDHQISFLKKELQISTNALAALTNRIAPRDWVFNALRIQRGEWIYGIFIQPSWLNSEAGGIPHWPSGSIRSRAYMKAKEAVEILHRLGWLSDCSVDSPRWIWEWGAAPGGSTQALIQHGFSIHSTDPAKLDPSVYDWANDFQQQVHHQLKRIEDVAEAPDCNWVFSDMNVGPEDLFHHFEKWLPRLRNSESFLGAALTIKIPSLSDYFSIQRQLHLRWEKWQPLSIWVRQLPVHRQEFLCLMRFR